jgi:hypothetical protein
MRIGRVGISGATVAIVVGLSLGLSSCGGGSPNPNTHTASAKPKVSATSTTTVVNRRESAVLTAYRAGWTAYDQALATANAYDSSLPKTLAQPLLQKVEAALLGDANGGIVGRGKIQLNPKVSSLTATTATVVDCTYSSSEYVYAKTGQPVPPLTKPEHDGVVSTLEFQSGSWKVSQQTVTDGTCSARS